MTLMAKKSRESILDWRVRHIPRLLLTYITDRKFTLFHTRSCFFTLPHQSFLQDFLDKIVGHSLYMPTVVALLNRRREAYFSYHTLTYTIINPPLPFQALILQKNNSSN